MPTLHEAMREYHQQLEKGVIQQAYLGIMKYLSELRTHFANCHPEFEVPGGLYAGYMDMSYFSLLTPELKGRKLKIAVVYLHKENHFEVWLSAVNKQVQKEYLDLFAKSGWQKYRLVPGVQGYDSILEFVVANEPDFAHLEGLTSQIENGTLQFIRDVTGFLEKR